MHTIHYHFLGILRIRSWIRLVKGGINVLILDV